jgi:CheY-like chemotaxis protein
MTLRVLICDDSGFACKQLARALPADWALEVNFAGHGAEALAALAVAPADLLLLDLNMPVMDGYQVLERLRDLQPRPLTVVVSGDIQPEAQRRVRELGAADFVRKPIGREEMAAVLRRLDLQPGRGPAALHGQRATDALDGYREIANVAMGRAADLMARLLGVFVAMPIPRVGYLEPGELLMAVQHLEDNARVEALVQGFCGFGIAGEALLLFSETSREDMARLVGRTGADDEVLVDLGGILIGACLQGVAEQLDISFSQNHPLLIGDQVRVSDLLARAAHRWRRTLAVELDFRIEGHAVTADLLLLFAEASVDILDRLIAGILGD